MRKQADDAHAPRPRLALEDDALGPIFLTRRTETFSPRPQKSIRLDRVGVEYGGCGGRKDEKSGRVVRGREKVGEIQFHLVPHVSSFCFFLGIC